MSQLLSYNTELNCHIANVCSGYTQVPDLTVRLLIDCADFWQTNARFQDDRTAMSYFARAEAFKAAAHSLAYKLTDCDCDCEDDSENGDS